jgi:hypothetical protein
MVDLMSWAIRASAYVRFLLFALLLAGCLQLAGFVDPVPAGAALYGSGRSYCSAAEAGGKPLGPSMPTPAGNVFACGPVPVDGNDSGPAIPKFWPIRDEGGFQCTELAIRYLYLVTDGRVFVNMKTEVYWSGAGKDFATSVGGHFAFGGVGQHLDGHPSASLPRVGDILSEMVSPNETSREAQDAARTYSDVGVVRSASASQIVLMVENNNDTGLNTIKIHSPTNWSINNPKRGFYYTTFRWFSPTSVIPPVTMPVSPYRYSVYGTSTIAERGTPSVPSAAEHLLPDGNTIYLSCQEAGPSVNGSSVWDKLTNGGWVPDFYVDTPDVGTFSYPVPPCTSPGYWDYTLQAPAPVKELAGPTAKGPPVETLSSGFSVQVVCLTSGTPVSGTTTWDYLRDRGYVSNAYVHAQSSAGIPQCPQVNPTGRLQNKQTGTTTTSRPSSGQKVSGATPGTGSPAAAVAGFYTELLVHESVKDACSYVVPSQQTDCLAGAALAGPVISTGHVQITATVTDVDRALVAMTGSVCQTGSPCIANSNTRLGLPSNLAGFDAAYTAALNNSGYQWGAVPCRSLGGKWYVDANI